MAFAAHFSRQVWGFIMSFSSPISLPELTVPHTLQVVRLYDDTAATNVLVPSASGKRVYVVGLLLFVNGATDLKFQSYNGTVNTPIDGSWGFGSSGGQVSIQKPDGDPNRTRIFPHLMTNVGEALVLQNSNSVRLGGSIFFFQQ